MPSTSHRSARVESLPFAADLLGRRLRLFRAADEADRFRTLAIFLPASFLLCHLRPHCRLGDVLPAFLKKQRPRPPRSASRATCHISVDAVIRLVIVDVAVNVVVDLFRGRARFTWTSTSTSTLTKSEEYS